MPLMLAEAAFEFGEQFWRGRDGQLGILSDDGIPQLLHRLKTLSHWQFPESFYVEDTLRHNRNVELSHVVSNTFQRVVCQLEAANPAPILRKCPTTPVRGIRPR